MYAMYKFSSIFKGLLHDELLVSNIKLSIVTEKKIVVHFCGWTGSNRLAWPALRGKTIDHTAWVARLWTLRPAGKETQLLSGTTVEK